MRWSRWRRIGLRLLAVMALVVLLRLLPREPAPLQDPQRIYRVQRVIDGDTLLLAGGQRVRLLGIDTPELARGGRPAEPWSAEARDFLDAALADRRVSFEFDRESHDKYGRRLVYAYHQGRLLNEDIIRAGFSRAETRFPYHESKKIRFRQAEREAREQRRGLWSEAAPARGAGAGR